MSLPAQAQNSSDITSVIQSLAPLPRRAYEDAQVVRRLALADVLGQTRGAQRQLELPLVVEWLAVAVVGRFESVRHVRSN